MVWWKSGTSGGGSQGGRFLLEHAQNLLVERTRTLTQLGSWKQNKDTEARITGTRISLEQNQTNYLMEEECETGFSCLQHWKDLGGRPESHRIGGFTWNKTNGALGI